MVEKTTTQKHAELKRLGKQSAQNIHAMLYLVNEILDDHKYVDGFGGEDQLVEMIEHDEFAHFGGDPALVEMLMAYRKFPRESQWREYAFNIRAMIELATPTREAKSHERTDWKALAKSLQIKIEQTEEKLSRAENESESLREMNMQLVSECGELRGRIAVLESLAQVSSAFTPA